jgi:hypothetical protein
MFGQIGLAKQRVKGVRHNGLVHSSDKSITTHAFHVESKLIGFYLLCQYYIFKPLKLLEKYSWPAFCE